MITPVTEAGAPAAYARRIVARTILTATAVMAVAVVVVQFDPGRFVYVQPLRGSTVMFVALYAMPVVVTAAFWLRSPQPVQAEALRARTTLTFLAFGAAVLLTPVVFLAGWRHVDADMDHQVAVVATAPDGTYDVISAFRDGDSGDYQILRARTRDGLFSRNSASPLAFVCDELVRVRFAGPDELVIVTRSIDEPFQQVETRLLVDRRTHSAAEQFSSCSGDQT